MSSPSQPYEILYNHEKMPLTDAPKAQVLRPRTRLRIAIAVVLVYISALLLLPRLKFFITNDDNTLDREAHTREEARWAYERAVHHREMRAWEHELVALQERREQWMREVEMERVQWAAERREEELRRIERTRAAQGVHWSEAWGNSRCSAYGTRAYNAHLLDIPEALQDEWYALCADMPNKFHGRWVDRPATCLRDRTGVWASWFINFEEPQCVTYWDTLNDVGCSAARSGKRRYEARLLNLSHRDDWSAMCSTTPATIDGIQFAHPTACTDKDGATGVWDVLDDTCF